MSDCPRRVYGECTLRAAIQEANDPDAPADPRVNDIINFNIPSCLPCTIMIDPLNGTLPMLTDSGTTINGFSQPGPDLGTLTLSGEKPGVDTPGNPCRVLKFVKPDIVRMRQP